MLIEVIIFLTSSPFSKRSPIKGCQIFTLVQLPCFIHHHYLLSLSISHCNKQNQNQDSPQYVASVWLKAAVCTFHERTTARCQSHIELKAVGTRWTLFLKACKRSSQKFFFLHAHICVSGVFLLLFYNL